ncbi:hypothetical protein BKA70DRAFT_1309123 [Coprinopsis sp. MPI-PUGE-AT-0042]|nr:hypothetical protein BKA70DRAFT_1309123 [Coprinopsis sp. MPI-PUGE-AT-0042]
MTNWPIEIIELVIQSSYTPKTLFNLALASSFLLPTAERQLYSRISVDAPKDGPGPLAMLSKNAKKASYVKFLSVQFAQGTGDAEDPDTANRATVKDYVMPLLKLTVNLVDIRLILQKYSATLETFETLTRCLCSGTFTLSTLFCSKSIDYIPVLRSQPFLRTVGIYGEKNISRPEPRQLAAVSRIGLLFVMLMLPNRPRDGDTCLTPEARIGLLVGSTSQYKPLGRVSFVRTFVENFEAANKLRALLAAVSHVCNVAPYLIFFARSNDGLFTQETTRAIQVFSRATRLKFWGLVDTDEFIITAPRVDFKSPIVVEHARRWGESLKDLEEIHYHDSRVSRDENGNWVATCVFRRQLEEFGQN